MIFFGKEPIFNILFIIPRYFNQTMSAIWHYLSKHALYSLWTNLYYRSFLGGWDKQTEAYMDVISLESIKSALYKEYGEANHLKDEEKMKILFNIILEAVQKEYQEYSAVFHETIFEIVTARSPAKRDWTVNVTCFVM